MGETSVCMSESTDHILDTCGLFCPEPVMLLHNKIRDINSGEVVRVIATDPSTGSLIPMGAGPPAVHHRGYSGPYVPAVTPTADDYRY